MNELIKTLKRSWMSHFWTNLATTGVLTLSFGLILATFLIVNNMGRALTVWGEEILVTVYLKEGIKPEQQKNLEKVFSKEPILDKFEYVDKKTAMKSFESSLKSYSVDLVESIKDEDENPFPASYVLNVKKNKEVAKELPELAKRLGVVAGVEDVTYGQEWVSNYGMLVQIFKMAALLFTMVLVVACLFTTSNAIRASMSARREEIEILELVGATKRGIRKPFILEGAVQGFLGMFCSLAVVGASFSIITNKIEGIAGGGGIASAIHFFPWLAVFGLLAFGVGVGALGSYLCVSQINSGWAAAKQGKV